MGDTSASPCGWHAPVSSGRPHRGVEVGQDRLVHLAGRGALGGCHDALILLEVQGHVAERLHEREVVERAKEVRFAQQPRLRARRNALRVRAALERRVQLGI